tara:strand:- start:562 stop:1122 length:561 start_codon:yes stop_codon:yes gene_type:complete
MSLTINHQTNDISATGAGSVTIGGAAVGGGPMELISSSTPNGVSSVTITGLTGYDSYRIVVNVSVGSSAGLAVKFRVRVGSGGTDVTTSTYKLDNALKDYSDLVLSSVKAYAGIINIIGLNEALPTVIIAKGAGDNAQTAIPCYGAAFTSAETGFTARNSITIYSHYSTINFVSGSRISVYGVKNT